MYYRNLENNRNICRSILLNGGTLTPLIISTEDSKGLGLMNPSILVDNGEVLINLRNVNYTLYHAEGKQLYNNRYGPLVYLHPENDQKLRTTNYVLRMNSDLTIREHHLIDTSDLDIEPIWEFVGLEDIRLVRWDKKLYGCGVRRDVKDNGEGRMELSELKYKGTDLKEVKRNRIQPPKDLKSYCEKNWMPVLDQPYTFVKWTNPTEVVKVNMEDNSSETIHLGTYTAPGMPDLRGGSQVIPFRNHYLCIVHDCDLFNNKLDQKDATYMHRWIVWDKDWNMIHVSKPWSFMDGEIEFCCGLCEWEDDLLVTFGFQDNAAYLLRIPNDMINDILEYDVRDFDWGPTPKKLASQIRKEITQLNHYEKFEEVKPSDIVVDIGANVGAFTKSIVAKKPKMVYCLEPSKTLFPVLQKNLKPYDVTYLNIAIAAKTEKGLSVKSNDKIYEQKTGTYDTVSFIDFIKSHDITNIDFLKVDAEGAEHDIFTEENKEWISTHVKHTAIEWHFRDMADASKRFKKFRDIYLQGNFIFRAIDTSDMDVTEKIFSDTYLRTLVERDAYIQVMIYISF